MKINNIRFELSFKSIHQLENKLNFCKLNGIKNINIPCKGVIKKEFFNSIFEYIKKNYKEFNIVYHYSLYNQYTKTKEYSYKEFLAFIKKCNSCKDYEILLVSGSNKKKDFDVINVLDFLTKEKFLNLKLGIAYNPYLKKYYNYNIERDRFKKKISSGLIKSVWLQYGTDIKVLEKEINHLKKNVKDNNLNIFGSLLIPSKQFISRYKFRPWKGVYISDRYLYSLDNFSCFTKDLIKYYHDNNIIPVIETDFFSKKKLDHINSLLEV